MMLGELKK